MEASNSLWRGAKPFFSIFGCLVILTAWSNVHALQVPDQVDVHAEPDGDTFQNGPNDTFYFDEPSTDQDAVYDDDDAQYDELEEIGSD